MEKTFAADLLRAVKDGHQKLTSMALTKPFEALLGVSFSSYRRSDRLGLFFNIYIYVKHIYIYVKHIYMYMLYTYTYTYMLNIYIYIDTHTTFLCQSQSWAPVTYFS